MNLTPELRTEYQGFWDSMLINATKVHAADGVVIKMTANRARYEAVASRTGVPWFFIAVVHSLEGNLSFRTHLHNGDSLTERTVRVPKGRPVSGRPPFTWEASAEDALRYEGLTQWGDWTVPGLLFKLELYNGWGYRKKGVRSPYLWSFSNHYASGKYVRDGVYDPKAVSAQIGAAVLLRRLVDRGHVDLVNWRTHDVASAREARADVPGDGVRRLADGSGAGPGSGAGAEGGGRDPQPPVDVRDDARRGGVGVPAPAVGSDAPEGAASDGGAPVIELDENELRDYAKAISESTLKLPRGAKGRQNDPGAALRPAGILIIPLATDPRVPDAVFAADLTELKQGRQSWHRVQTLRDGEIGNKWNVKPGGGNDAAALVMQLLSGNLLPGVLGKMVAGGDPLKLLTTLLDEQAKGRDPW